jgi:hypothetical protein
MDLEADIKRWIDSVSELRPDLGGFAICPFAKKSSYKIIPCKLTNIIPITDYDVLIFVVEDNLSLNQISEWVDFYNQKYPKFKFFEDCASYDTFINGIQTNNGKYNLILAQPKEKLKKFREILTKTNYYDYWDNDYLKEILEDDYNILEKG